MHASRYLIGIDLGTSNCALSYVDTLDAAPHSIVLPIAQLHAPGAVAESPTLPSFLYLPTPEEESSGALRTGLSHDVSRYIAGGFALSQTARLPGRVISSAKSWLCHGGVDREAPILPWSTEEIAPEERLSPVEVSAEFLRALARSWDASVGAYHEDYRFDRQTITITVPASFDEAAQRLTLQAAELAGYPSTVRLLEEPQAAFYRWLEQHGAASLFRRPSEELRVLVCDVGGGTTDFSLFAIRRSAEEVPPEVRRIAVSEHILLGGDNIDLTIAHLVEGRLRESRGGQPLSTRQWQHLVFAARLVKEKALAEAGDESGSEKYHIAIPAEGSGLFTGSLSAELEREELHRLILDGFFPLVERDARASRRVTGLKEWGLPFAEDSAVTRHLADFLEGAEVDAVLYNGGTLIPPFIRERLTDLLAEWQGDRRPTALHNPEMEVAVARGAAFASVLQHQAGGGISGGYARSLYLEVEDPTKPNGRALVCILPQGMADGTSLTLEEPAFKLRIGKPVRFQLYSSTHRAHDRPGDITTLDDRFHPLPPLQTVLTAIEGEPKPQDGMIDGRLLVQLNDTGLLQLFCLSGSGRWQLEFNLRKEEAQAPQAAAIDDALLQKLRERIGIFYGKGKSAPRDSSPRKLVRELEELTGHVKEEWDIALLRAIWEPLSQGITRRGRSLAHETTWLYLAGFVLRPGYGAELDEWRVQTLWRCHSLGLSFPKESSAQVQWWIMWRRVAGGLQNEQQEELFNDGFRRFTRKGEDSPELIRLLGSLERVSPKRKTAFGEELLKRISGRRSSGIEHYIWAFGRVAGRVPLYGSPHLVVSAEQVARWFDQLAELDWSTGDLSGLNAAFSAAARRTGDRERDLPDEARQEVLHKLRRSGASPEQLQVVQDIVPVNFEDQVRLFGEELPIGVRLA